MISEQIGPELRDEIADYLRYHQGSAETADELADVLLPLVFRCAALLAADELEAEAAYDDAAPDEQYARYLFATRLRQRAANLRFDADEDGAS